jgi:hypothetical protein
MQFVKMEKILHYIINYGQVTYFNAPIIIICASFFIYKILFLKHNVKFYTAFVIYLISLIVLFGFNIMAFIMRENGDWPCMVKKNEVLNLWFIAIEITVVLSFLKYIINSSFVKKIIQGTKLLSICLLIAFYFKFFNIDCTHELTTTYARKLVKIGEIIEIIKCFILIIFILFYFYEIYHKNELLKHEAIIPYAFFCYSVIGILSFSIEENIRKYQVIFRLIPVIYSILMCIVCYAIFSYLKKQSNLKSPSSKSTINQPSI